MNKLKKIGKELLMFLVMVAFGAGVILLLDHYRKSKLNAEKQATAAIQLITDSTAHYRDLYNREHAIRRQIETDAATAQVLFAELLDSVAKSVRTKTKDISGVIAMSTYTADNVTGTARDTVYMERPATQIRYSDKWLWLQGIVVDSLAHLNYQIYDSIIIATYTKRKNIFATKETFIDAYSLNPHARVNTITSFRISAQRPKRWTIGPSAGYGWTGTDFKPFIGLSVQYSLIRL